MTLEFETVEQLYQHYQQVAHRVGSRRYVYPITPVARGIPPRPKPAAPAEPPPRPPPPPVPTPEEFWARVEAGEVPKSRRAALRMVECVAVKHGLTLEDAMGKSKLYKISHMRQECYWWLNRKFGFSTPVTAEVMGGKDHTSILHGVKAHEKRINDR